MSYPQNEQFRENYHDAKEEARRKKKAVAKKMKLPNRYVKDKHGTVHNPHQSDRATKRADLELHGYSHFIKKHGESEYKKFIK